MPRYVTDGCGGSIVASSMRVPARCSQLPIRIWILGLALLCALWIGAELTGIVNRQGLMLPNGIQPVGRDFVVFYSASRIVASGDGAHLYDLQWQHGEMSRILGSEPYPLTFAYPAFYALLYLAVSDLPYLWAFGLAFVAMTAALVGGVWMLRSVSPTVRQHPLLVLVALFAYYPVTWQAFGGLNVGLTLLCLAGAYTALRHRRERAAGVWLGLLLFKPQFAVPLLGLLAWRRQWQSLATAALTGGLLSLVAAIWVAPTWPLDFVRLVLGEKYHSREAMCCGGGHVALPAVASYSFPGSHMAEAVVVGLGIGTVALTRRFWRGESAAEETFALKFGLALALSIAFSPHAVFYETGLLIIPVIALVDRWRREPGDGSVTQRLSGKQQIFLAGLLAGGMTWPLVRVIGVQPMALLPLIVGAACWHQLRKAPDVAHLGTMQPIPLDSLVDQRSGHARPSLAERRAS